MSDLVTEKYGAMCCPPNRTLPQLSHFHQYPFVGENDGDSKTGAVQRDLTHLQIEPAPEQQNLESYHVGPAYVYHYITTERLSSSTRPHDHSCELELAFYPGVSNWPDGACGYSFQLFGFVRVMPRSGARAMAMGGTHASPCTIIHIFIDYPSWSLKTSNRRILLAHRCFATLPETARITWYARVHTLYTDPCGVDCHGTYRGGTQGPAARSSLRARNVLYSGEESIRRGSLSYQRLVSRRNRRSNPLTCRTTPEPPGPWPAAPIPIAGCFYWSRSGPLPCGFCSLPVRQPEG